MPTLSVCLIVKNEAEHLPRCLESIRGLADEIVVVDTGSTDDTIHIARAHGAKIRAFTWQDDFSAARNASIAEATGDWILALDADESIAACDHDRLRAAIRRSDADAFVVAQRHYVGADAILVGWQPGSGGYTEGEPYSGYVDVDCRRLFRRAPWLRFCKPVHEELASTDAMHPLRDARGDWVIHHYGKLAGRERLRRKGESYLRIGQRKADERPRDPQAHFELGVQYAELADYAEAIACFERALSVSPRYQDARFRIGLCRYELKDYEGALAAFHASADSGTARRSDIALAEGNAFRELGRFDAAEQAFRRALTSQPALPAAAMNLALLFVAQQRSADAIASVIDATRRFPDHSELRVLLGSLRVDAGDEEGALQELARVPDDPRAIQLRARVLVRQRRFTEARALLTTLPTGGDAARHALDGAVALGCGDLDGALCHLQRSVDLQPTVEAAMNLSTALEARGERTGALAAAAQASRLSPGDIRILARVAQLGEFQRAARSPRLTIAFYQPRSVPFDGNTPRTRGLGGTESAIVYLAEALAARDHRVLILNNCDAPVTIEGVEYRRWESLAATCVAERPDVLVAVRFWEPIGAARLAPLQIFWTGDAYDQPFVSELSNDAKRREIDFVMLQSEWQIETFARQHHLPVSQLVRTTLGAASTSNPKSQVPKPKSQRGRRLAYASTPFRGLDVLLDLFPRIRHACPDAELDVYSSMQVYGMSASDDARQFDAIYRKARQPGVTLVGSLPQPTLAARLQHARVLAYPNHYAETFCIAVAEAQAAGCAVVTSALGALPETVGEAGMCIPGDPRSTAYQQAFVDACVSLLRDNEKWASLSAHASEQAATRYAWPGIAERWESLIRAALTDEPAEIERIAVHLTAGRAALADRMLAKIVKPESISVDAWDSLRRFVSGQVAGTAPLPAADLSQLALYFPSLRRSGLLDRTAPVLV